MQSSKNQVTFQLDTGAEYNLLSLKDYRCSMDDVDLAQTKRCSHKFISILLPMNGTRYWGRQHSLHGAMGQFNITLPHCYLTAHLLNWDSSQLMAVIAPQIPVISRILPA